MSKFNILNPANYSFNPHAIPVYIVGLLILIGGIFVRYKNKRSIVTLSFLFTCISVSVWLTATAMGYMSKVEKIAAWWFKLDNFGVMFISVSILFFTKTVLGNKRYKSVIAGYLIAFILGLIVIRTNWLVMGAKKYFWGFFPIWGFFSVPVFILFFGYMGASFASLFGQYKKGSLTPLKKNQIRYLIMAYLIGYTGSADFLPTFGIKIYPFGYLSIAVFLTVIAYAIIKYRLMDIKVAITRAGVFAIVYILVLGIPLGLTAWGKLWLEGLFGQNWYWAPMILSIILATAGPFIFMHLLRRAEEIVFKERRHYQEVINNLSKSMVDIRDIEKLFTNLTSTVVNAVKIKFATIYLREEDYKSYQFKSYYPKEAKSRFEEFIPLDDPLIDILNQRKKPQLSEEIGHQDKINLDSGLVIPCFGKDGLLAIIILGAKPNNDMYTNDDVLSFENLSYATSLAIENCTYWKEIEDRQRRARIQEMDLFSYSLAHEIDNPMNNIKTVATYLKDFFLKELSLAQEKQKEAQSGLEAILESQERVSGMVKAIEEFGKPTAGEFGPLRLEEVTATYLNLYLAIFKNHGIFFTKELPDKIPFLRGVKQEIMEVLANLSDNAIHALLDTKEKKISLKVEVPNQDIIRIIFKDNGYGITEEKIRTIFAPFVTTKASTEGKGFGLYNCRRIIERHKGKIWAESEGKNKGATFFIELPIAKDVTEEDLKKEDKGKRLF